mgnify:CR=1 FL=1
MFFVYFVVKKKASGRLAFHQGLRIERACRFFGVWGLAGARRRAMDEAGEQDALGADVVAQLDEQLHQVTTSPEHHGHDDGACQVPEQLRAAKDRLDPRGNCNPGVLLPE